MKPGKTYRVSPPPMLAANVFLEGPSRPHRGVVEQFPELCPQPQHRERPYTSTETALRQTRCVTAHRPLSKLVLPVVKP